MTTEYSLRSRIDHLTRGLKSVSPKLGYSETRVGGRTIEFKVHTLVFGDVEIPVRAGTKLAALEKVLRELEILAQHYKPSLLLPSERRVPLWLAPDARTFALRATAREKGVHLFGKVIEIPGKPVPGLHAELVAKRTREQVVYVSTNSVEAFRYFPTDEARYKGSAQFRAAMDWNLSMYTYVQQRGDAPSVAREKLASLNRELLRRLILELALPGWSDAIGAGGDILQELVHIIRR